MKIVSNLISSAERIANTNGEKNAGAEHLVQAAFEMPDGTARQVFERLGVEPSAFKTAIDTQQTAALDNIGIDTTQLDFDEDDIKADKPTFPSTQPSAQSILQSMAANTRFKDAQPVTGAMVLMAVAEMEHGVAARAIKHLGVNRESLLDAATEILQQ